MRLFCYPKQLFNSTLQLALTWAFGSETNLICSLNCSRNTTLHTGPGELNSSRLLLVNTNRLKPGSLGPLQVNTNVPSHFPNSLANQSCQT